MIVMKFGGTSVADRAAIERVVSIVRAARQAAIQPESSDWRGPVVVVSALGGATDRLLGIAAQAGAGDIDGARDHLRALCARHLDVAGIVTQPDERKQVDQFIREAFDELERIAGALGVLREVTPRWLDVIAATGEIVAAGWWWGADVAGAERSAGRRPARRRHRRPHLVVRRGAGDDRDAP